MNKPTEAQREEFWKWCGFEYNENIKGSTWVGGKWKYPSGAYNSGLPSIDPISLFRHSVPKARASGVTKIVFLYFEDSIWCQLFGSFQAEKEIACGKAETEEDALFWALWQLKESIGSRKY